MKEVIIVKDHSVANRRMEYVATWLSVFKRNSLQRRRESADAGLSLQVGAGRCNDSGSVNGEANS